MRLPSFPRSPGSVAASFKVSLLRKRAIGFRGTFRMAGLRHPPPRGAKEKKRKGEIRRKKLLPGGFRTGVRFPPPPPIEKTNPSTSRVRLWDGFCFFPYLLATYAAI